MLIPINSVMAKVVKRVIYMTLLTTLAITELIGINIHEINLLTHIINVILWVLIGAIIGWMIKNRRKDDRNN